MIYAILTAVAVVITIIFGKKAVLKSNPIYSRYSNEIMLASREWNVPPEIILGVIETESRGDPTAVGGSGEVGLMQLKPGQLIVDVYEKGWTPRRSPSFDVKENIWDGTAGLRLLKDLTGDWRTAIRAYNCCGTNISRVKSNPSLSSGYADEVIGFARSNGWAGLA